MVECQPSKLDVEGSSPFFRSRLSSSCGYNSIGRMSASQAESCRFESDYPLPTKLIPLSGVGNAWTHAVEVARLGKGIWDVFMIAHILPRHYAGIIQW
jgi:hypothetical protein